MTSKALFGTGVLALLLTACVTINIYFPEAQADQAVKAIVKDVLGKDTAPPAPAPDGEKGTGLDRPWLWLGRLPQVLLDWVVPAAQAAEPDFTVDSPEIRRVQATMKQRQTELRPFFESGAVGFTADGFVATRDAGAVPLRDRNKVKGLVEQENQDRKSLYRAVAQANGHPDWEGQIQGLFAKRWIAEAPSGWWYQTGTGAWQQK